PAAEIVVEHTEAILREMELARAEVAATRSELTGLIRLATFQTAAHTFVPAAISRLHDLHPGVSVGFSHIGAEDALPALRAGDFDLVLSEQYPGLLPHRAPGAETINLLEDPLLLAVPAGWEASGLTDLAHRPWAMEHPGTDPREWADGVCRAAGFVPHIAYQSADVHLHVRLVEQGDAPAFLPALALPDQASFQVLPAAADPHGTGPGPHRSLLPARRCRRRPRPPARRPSPTGLCCRPGVLAVPPIPRSPHSPSSCVTPPAGAAPRQEGESAEHRPSLPEHHGARRGDVQRVHSAG